MGGLQMEAKASGSWEANVGPTECSAIRVSVEVVQLQLDARERSGMTQQSRQLTIAQPLRRCTDTLSELHAEK